MVITSGRGVAILAGLLLGLLLGLTFFWLPGRIQVSAQEPAAEDYFLLRRQADEKVKSQQWNDVVALWDRVTRANPYIGDNWAQLAYARYQARDYRGAAAAYDQAMKLGAGFPFTSAFNIARCYTQLGDKEKAFEWLDGQRTKLHAAAVCFDEHVASPEG